MQVLIRSAAFAVSMAFVGATAAFAQTSPPSTPAAPPVSAAAGCTYTPTSATATSGIGAGAPRHLDEGQTVTNMASHVTYVCHNGHLARQQ